MKTKTVCGAFVLGCLAQPLTGQAPEEVRLRLSDSLVLVGDLYRSPAPADSPVVILYHQGGGDARGEYRDIIPRLLAERLHLLAVDIRGGGSRFGTEFRGAAAGPGFRYCQAYREVEAAISLARANRLYGPLILWGSSYTATLAIQAGARRMRDVAGVLAFSPASGELLQECEPVQFAEWLKGADIPLLLVRSSAELEQSEARARHDRLAALASRVVVPRGSGHGSSLLVEGRFEGDLTLQWEETLAFLRSLRPPASRIAGAEPVTIPSGEWRLQGDLVLPQDGREPTPAVLLLSGGVNQYAVLVRELSRQGFAVLQLDLRGEGLSTNRGRFIPYVSQIQGAEKDVAAALAYLRSLQSIDSSRIAVVSGSAGSEAVARALRTGSAARAVVSLSPGSFSDESFARLAGSPTSWLFVRADRERFVTDWLDRKVRSHSSEAEVWVVAAGSAHATTLLVADAGLPARLAEWIQAHLR